MALLMSIYNCYSNFEAPGANEEAISNTKNSVSVISEIFEMEGLET